MNLILILLLLIRLSYAQTYYCTKLDLCNAKKIADLSPGWVTKKYSYPQYFRYEEYSAQQTHSELKTSYHGDNIKTYTTGIFEITSAGEYTFRIEAQLQNAGITAKIDQSISFGTGETTVELDKGYHHLQANFDADFQQPHGDSYNNWNIKIKPKDDPDDNYASPVGFQEPEAKTDFCAGASAKTCADLNAASADYLGCASRELGNCLVPSSADQAKSWCTAQFECRKYLNSQWQLVSSTCQSGCSNHFTGSLTQSGCEDTPCFDYDCVTSPPTAKVHNVHYFPENPTVTKTLSKSDLVEDVSTKCPVNRCYVNGYEHNSQQQKMVAQNSPDIKLKVYNAQQISFGTRCFFGLDDWSTYKAGTLVVTVASCDKAMIDSSSYDVEYADETLYKHRAKRCVSNLYLSSYMIDTHNVIKPSAVDSSGTKRYCSLFNPPFYISSSPTTYAPVSQDYFTSNSPKKVGNFNAQWQIQLKKLPDDLTQKLEFYTWPRTNYDLPNGITYSNPGKTPKKFEIMNTAYYSSEFQSYFDANKNKVILISGPDHKESDQLVWNFNMDSSAIMGNCGSIVKLELRTNQVVNDMYFQATGTNECDPRANQCNQILKRKAENYEVVEIYLRIYDDVTTTDTWSNVPSPQQLWLQFKLQCSGEVLPKVEGVQTFQVPIDPDPQSTTVQKIVLDKVFPQKYFKCIAGKFYAYSDEALTTNFVNPVVEIVKPHNGNYLPYIEVKRQYAVYQQFYIKAVPTINDADHWSVAQIKVLICGGEQLQKTSSEPYKVQFDSWLGKYTIKNSEIQSLVQSNQPECPPLQVDIRQIDDSSVSLQGQSWISLSDVDFTKAEIVIDATELKRQGLKSVSFFIRYIASSNSPLLKRIDVNIQQLRDNCLGGIITQAINTGGKLDYKLNEESNQFAQVLRQQKLSILQEPIEFIFREFELANSTLARDPSCNLIDYEMELYFYEGQLIDGSNLEHITPVKSKHQFIKYLKNSVSPDQLETQSIMQGKKPSSFMIEQKARLDKNEKYNMIIFDPNNLSISNMTYQLRIDASMKYGDDIPERLKDINIKKQTFFFQFEVGVCEPRLYQDTSENLTAFGNQTMIEYFMNNGTVLRKSPFDGLISFYPDCGKSYRISQQINYTDLSLKTSQDFLVVSNFIKLNYNPEGNSTFELKSNNYQLIKVHEIRIIVTAINAFYRGKLFKQQQFQFYLNSTYDPFEENKPPLFNGTVKSVFIASNESLIPAYTLPNVYDPNRLDSVSVQLLGSNFNKFGQYSIKQNTLYFNENTLKMDDDFEFQVILKDDNAKKPLSTVYNFTIVCQYCQKKDADKSSKVEFVFDIQPKDDKEDKEKESTQQQIIKQKRNEAIFKSIDEKEKPKIRVGSISTTGELKIYFSEDMEYPPSWEQSARRLLSDELQKFIDISIASQDPKIKEELTFNSSISELSSRQLKLQLDFDNPSLVSMSSQSDQDSVMILFTTAFQEGLKGKYSRRTISFKQYQGRTTVFRRIPPQLANNEKTKAFKNQVEAAEGGLASLFTLEFMLSFSLSFSMNFMWSVINCLQMIVFLPLFNITFPARLNLILSYLVNIACFDVVPKMDDINMAVYNFDETLEELDVNSQGFELLEYETRNFIMNLGSMYLFCQIYLMKLLVIAMITCYSRKWEKRGCIKVKRFLRDDQRVKQIILKFLIEGYVELFLSCILSIELMRKEIDQFSDKLAIYSGFVTWFIVLILPIFVAYITYKKIKTMQLLFDYPVDTEKSIIASAKLTNTKLDLNYGVLFEDIRQFDISALRMNYQLMFILRRMIFISVAYYFDDYVSFQLMINCFVSLLQLEYVIISMPWRDKTQSYMEVFNESTVMLSSYCLFYFTDFIPSADLKIKFGDGFLMLLGCNIFVNVVVIIYKTIIEFRRRKQQQKYQKNLKVLRQRLNKRFNKPYQKVWIDRAERQKKTYSEVVEEEKLRREMFMIRHVPGYNNIEKKEVEIEIENLDEGTDQQQLQWFQHESIILQLQDTVQQFQDHVYRERRIQVSKMLKEINNYNNI